MMIIIVFRTARWYIRRWFQRVWMPRTSSRQN